MDNYTINEHLTNMESLYDFYNFTESPCESKMFSLVNDLADFIQTNTKYSSMFTFDIITNLLIETIVFCNGSEYNFNDFKEKYNSVLVYLPHLIKEIKEMYPINAYFAGNDKYRLIDVIVSKDVNFKNNQDFIKDKNIKKDNAFNVLILSEETYLPSSDLSNFDKIIYYDKFMNDAFNLVQQEYYQNYDYNYLVNAIKVAKDSKTDSIFVGHSYSLNGVDEAILNGNVVNLSLSSQDLYYSFSIAREIIDNNPKIKQCYIGTAYWSFYFDLSMAHNSNELARIEKVYNPIFGDCHNLKNINNQKYENELTLNKQIDLLSRYIFSMEKTYTCLTEILFHVNQTYFNTHVKREFFSLIGAYQVRDLDEASKYRLGEERAEMHNKLIRYTPTRNENERIMAEFIGYLNTKNVEPIIVNFPTSKYYNQFITEEFKIEYYNIFSYLKNKTKFRLIDLNDENNLFSDEDFRDLDHMNSIGATKITHFINQKLG